LHKTYSDLPPSQQSSSPRFSFSIDVHDDKIRRAFSRPSLLTLWPPPNPLARSWQPNIFPLRVMRVPSAEALFTLCPSFISPFFFAETDYSRPRPQASSILSLSDDESPSPLLCLPSESLLYFSFLQSPFFFFVETLLASRRAPINESGSVPFYRHSPRLRSALAKSIHPVWIPLREFPPPGEYNCRQRLPERIPLGWSPSPRFTIAINFSFLVPLSLSLEFSFF